MTQTAPSPVDILDFQFKLQCRLKVFQNEDIPQFNRFCNILAVASKYGLLFVGSNDSLFQVIQIQSIQKYSTKDGEITDYLRRTIFLPSIPEHLSVNCDSSKLGVVIKKDGYAKAIIYDVSSFLQQNSSVVQEIILSSIPETNILESVWNPAVPSVYTVCKDDGSLGVYDLKGTAIEINELQNTVGATCICWSPKGKQIAVGSRDGKITQYKPDLKVAKVISGPPFEDSRFPISLQWISNYQFIAVYRSNAIDSQSSLIVINSPKVGEVTYINYEDICYSCGVARPHQFYMLLQNVWNILMVASANSMEVGVMGFEKDIWTQWILSDSARAELPLSITKQDTLPVGLCLDTSSSQPLPWGENTLPPAPLLMILSNHGVLCCFYAINLKEGATQICQPPEIVSNNSTTMYFSTSSERGGPLPNKPIPINPMKQNAPLTIQPIATTTTFAFTFNQPSKPIPSISQQPLTQSLSYPQPVKHDNNIIPVQTVFNLNLKPTATTLTSESSTLLTSKSVTENQLKNTQEKIQSQHQPLFDKKMNMINGRTILSPMTKRPPKPETLPTFDMNEDTEALIAQMVKEECATLELELKILLQRSQNVKIDLGTDNEATNLVQNTNSLQEFLEEINDIAQTQSAEIHYLKQTLIQTWAWYEEARSRFNTNKDPTLVTLMRVQPLDAASARQLEDVRHLVYYLESQLSQANAALDEQWENFQDSCKKRLSLKLPSIETIYQSMVKQSATIQKQVYMLKDVSNRIKMKARISTIPHLLVSLDNADKLEEQLKSLRIDSKDLFQLQYEKVFERQKYLSTNKIKELRNLLKSRHVVHVSVNKPQLLDRTTQLSGLISAPFSPIALTKKLQPTKLNFEQSTPKPIANSKEFPIIKNTELTKMSLKKEGIGDETDVNTKTFQNSATQELMNSQTTENKNIISITSTKPRDISILANSNNSIFDFDENKTQPGSAFVPTTQNIFGIKNTLFGATTSSNIPTNKIIAANSDAQQKSIFSFTTPVCLVTSATKPISTSTTSVSIFSTPIPSTVADSIQKPSLFITKPPNTAVSTSKFIFGTSLPSNVNTFASTTDTSSKLTFSFSNISTTKSEGVSVQSGNVSTLSTFKGLDTNTSTSSPKFIFSLVSQTPTSKSLAVTSTTSNMIIIPTSSTTASAFNSNSFEISPSAISDSKSFSLFSSSIASTDNAKTLSITQTIKTVTTPASMTVTNTSPFSVTSLSKIGTSITITPVTSTSPQPTSAAISNVQVLQPTSPTGIDLTTAKGKHLNVTTSTTSTLQPKGTFSSTETKSSLFNTTNTESRTTTASSSLFSTPTTSSIFNATPIYSGPETGSNSIFGVPQQSTSLSFGTTQQPTSSFFTTPQQTPSIFGGSQLIPFGAPQKANTCTNSNLIFSGNATAASTPIFGASQTPSFGTNTLVSSHTLTTPTIQPAFSTSNTTIPSLFCTNNVPSSTAQTSLFDTTATNSSTSPQVFGTSNATSCTTQAPMFGFTTQTPMFGTNTASNSASMFRPPTTQTSIFGSSNASASSGNIFGTTNDSMFPVIKTTSGSIFGSVPSTFSIANTTSTNFFTPSSSTSPIFGQPATFGSSSIFNTPTSTNTGNIFGNISTIPTNAFGNTSTSFGTSNTSTPFGSAFGSSTNNTSPFGFSAATGTNTPSSSGGFGFNKSSFTTFGSNSNSTDTASFSFGNLELSTTTSTAFGSGFTQNPFNRTSNQEQKSPFSGGSLFGTPVATSSSSIFGGSSPFNKTTPAFGGPATFGSTPAFGQGSTFGQNTFNSNGNMFGNSSQPGPFSGGSQSINQSGFGAPAAFGSSSTFGSSSSGGFGSSPTFGSSAFGVNSGFNTSNKPFSMPSDTFGTSTQQSSTFANLANQPTLGFGNLAQQNQTPTSQSTFSGGSSFLNWR